tara:strand:+ start:668 stop:1051 length:384 start_codon:yes stop_codon:yes gene_type:complete
MANHPVPEGDDIILPDGTVVGSWNGDDAKDLQVEVQRIIKEQKESGADRNNLLIRFGIPHMDQTPDHLKNFIAYALWGVDKKGMALTHRRADHFEHLDKINEKYGSETAIAAAQRHRDDGEEDWRNK